MAVSDAEFNTLKLKHRVLSRRVRKLARTLEALAANGLLPKAASKQLRAAREELDQPEDTSPE